MNIDVRIPNKVPNYKPVLATNFRQDSKKLGKFFDKWNKENRQKN